VGLFYDREFNMTLSEPLPGLHRLHPSTGASIVTEMAADIGPLRRLKTRKSASSSTQNRASREATAMFDGPTGHPYQLTLAFSLYGTMG
jgi:hypothetical protein